MITAKNVTVGHLVDYITEKLDCSQSYLAKSTGLNPSTISANLTKPLSEVVSKKAGRRLTSLYLAVHSLASQGISVASMRECLIEHVYEDLDGNFDSVQSSILTDKYPAVVIVNIAQIALQKYRETLKKRSEPMHSFLMNLMDR